MSQLFKAIADFLAGFFHRDKPGVERPSSPEIWRNPDAPWYKDDNGQTRVHKEDLFIPFTEDPKVIYSGIADTNSEDPLIDAGGHAECLQANNDIDHEILCQWIAWQWYDSSGMLAALVVYQVSDGGLILHRVKSVSQDSYGRYWRYLGDNNADLLDPIYARDFNIWAIVSGTKY